MFMLTFRWIIVGESGRDIRICDFLPPTYVQLILIVIYMKFVIFFHQNKFEVIYNVIFMKFLICVHQKKFEFICNVIYTKFVICLQKNDYEPICNIIYMLNLGSIVR
jgi:hypothetical protein